MRAARDPLDATAARQAEGLPLRGVLHPHADEPSPTRSVPAHSLATARIAVACCAASPGFVRFARTFTTRIGVEVRAERATAVRTICPPPSPWDPSISSTARPLLHEPADHLGYLDEQEGCEADDDRLEPVQWVQSPPRVEHGLEERDLNRGDLERGGNHHRDDEFLVRQA